AGQRAHADSGARMPPAFAKHLDKEIGAAVDDLGMIFEIGGGVYHAEHLHMSSTLSRSPPSASLIAAISTSPTPRAWRYPSSIDMPAPSLPFGIVPPGLSGGPLPEI